MLGALFPHLTAVPTPKTPGLKKLQAPLLTFINHYIVIYGYNSSENEFVCHYGWPGKSCIYVNRDLRTNIWGDYVIAELEY